MSDHVSIDTTKHESSDPEPEFSSNRSRAVTVEVFGIACYERDPADDGHGGWVNYLHRGVVGTEEDARLWLSGQTPESLIAIFAKR